VQDWKYGWVGIGHGFKTDQPEIREKPANQNPGIKLLMRRSITAFKYKEGFSVLGSGAEVEVRGAEWADWDHAGRLVFARGGKLFASDVSSFPEISESQLADFNSLKPEPCESPDWARRW
jgi:hypothetical protein